LWCLLAGVGMAFLGNAGKMPGTPRSFLNPHPGPEEPRPPLRNQRADDLRTGGSTTPGRDREWASPSMPDPHSNLARVRAFVSREVYLERLRNFPEGPGVGASQSTVLARVNRSDPPGRAVSQWSYRPRSLGRPGLEEGPGSHDTRGRGSRQGGRRRGQGEFPRDSEPRPGSDTKSRWSVTPSTRRRNRSSRSRGEASAGRCLAMNRHTRALPWVRHDRVGGDIGFDPNRITTG